MPIYEFYCEPCNTIFNFFSRTVTIAGSPACPRCGGSLQRKVSLFACIGKAREPEGPEDMPIDEARMEKAMSALASEAEGLSDDDPRQAANLMRKFSEMTGVELGGGMQEALKRLEAGEDPEKIEAEMGDILESEEPFVPGSSSGKSKKKPPARDETLYEM